MNSHKAVYFHWLPAVGSRQTDKASLESHYSAGLLARLAARNTAGVSRQLLLLQVGNQTTMSCTQSTIVHMIAGG